ncbi:MAG TPA: xanthine dehydrogenase family protein subunit M [Candidatus Atribacteria bacterium]|nr:xanthine dehydrogenase family protein subunit M [Candidatus Atribacteria bacterium]
MSLFKYISPKTKDEVLEILQKEKSNACIVAGCSNVLPNIRDKEIKAKVLIDITNIEQLKGIYQKEDKIFLGPLTTINELIYSDITSKEYKVLTQAAQEFADPLVRNTATIGGNLVTASPAADIAIPLLTLDALIKIESTRDKREVKLKDFFVGPGETILQDDEMIVGIEFEQSDVNKNGYFIKIGQRKAMAISIATVAVNLEVRQNKINQIRIAAGSVAPTPVRLTGAESFLKNKEINDKLVEEAIDRVREEVKPISDIRASEEYRRYISGLLFKRAFKKLADSSIHQFTN